MSLQVINQEKSSLQMVMCLFTGCGFLLVPIQSSVIKPVTHTSRASEHRDSSLPQRLRYCRSPPGLPQSLRAQTSQPGVRKVHCDIGILKVREMSLRHALKSGHSPERENTDIAQARCSCLPPSQISGRMQNTAGEAPIKRHRMSWRYSCCCERISCCVRHM